MTAPAYIQRAAQGLLRPLRAAGHAVETVDQAITQGLITDMDWCAALEAYRPHPSPAVPYHRLPKQHGRRRWQ